MEVIFLVIAILLSIFKEFLFLPQLSKRVDEVLREADTCYRSQLVK